MTKIKYSTPEQYYSAFPETTKKQLRRIEKLISTAAPLAKHIISYNMPAYKQNKNLIYFAAYKNHIGLYPGPKAILQFRKELNNFKTTKGAIQFPLNNPLPEKLIIRIVNFCVKNDAETETRHLESRKLRQNKNS